LQISLYTARHNFFSDEGSFTETRLAGIYINAIEFKQCRYQKNQHLQAPFNHKKNEEELIQVKN
jgi:hypothetical protein